MQAARIAVHGVYTPKLPGGVTYRCSFRVAQAVHMIEWLTNIMAQDLGQNPADLRLKNFIPPDRIPYESPTVWE